MMGTSAKALLAALPIELDDITIRSWLLEDVERLAEWPSYPFPYEPFNFSFRGVSSAECKAAFEARERRTDRVTLVADKIHVGPIGYVALLDVAWELGEVGNMSYRIHPQWCSKGLGTPILRETTDWCMREGIARVRLDVAASNGRAIRCYERAGFQRTGDFWRADEVLRTLDLAQPQYDFLRDHVRVDDSTAQLRFWWMEKTPDSR